MATAKHSIKLQNTSLIDLASDAERTQMNIQASLDILGDYISGMSSTSEGQHLTIGLQVLLENVLQQNKKLTDSLYSSSRSSHQQVEAQHG